MTQLQLSLASGVPQQTISAIESGERRNPGVLTIRKLADAMECTIDELYPSIHDMSYLAMLKETNVREE